MLVMKNDHKAAPALTASQMKAGQMFVFKDNEIKPENVMIAVCHYDHGDKDVRIIRPFCKLDNLDEPCELDYIGEYQEVIPVTIIVEEIKAT